MLLIFGVIYLQFDIKDHHDEPNFSPKELGDQELRTKFGLGIKDYA